MKQEPFESLYAPTWQAFDALVQDIDKLSPARAYELPDLYRKICNHYAIARARYYSPTLVADLHRRVRTGHELLYRQKSAWFWRALGFLWIRFPGQVRAHYKYFWLACALFYLPALGMGFATYLDQELIYSVMPASQVANMEYLYDPTTREVGRSADRQSDTDFMMFGYYIYNNISIGFRCFALGILFGVGTMVILIYNGVTIGGVAGHVTQLGYIETFWPFVSGHGAFELTAIIISGAAGLRLARPLISPGQLTRLAALRVAGRDSVDLICGAAAMLTIAAFIEAFWSSSTLVSIPLKLMIAAVLWMAVIAYLLFAGKVGYANRTTDDINPPA